MKVTVLGAGSWGSALAKVLADNHHEVTLWAREHIIVDEWNRTHTNPQYLPGVLFPAEIQATTDLEQALTGSELIVMVIPTSGIRDVSRQVREFLAAHPGHSPIIVHAAKGIEPDTHLRISQMIEAEIPRDLYQALAVLSGPSHAEEVAVEQLTAVVVASQCEESAVVVQEAFMTPYFRIYLNADITGVELGGALKNIIAVGAGIISELGYGDNVRAALITRGLAEMTRLGVALGADPLTFSGLSGLGDLIVTTTSIHSRNFRAGRLLARGHSVEQVEREVHMVVEGIRTCLAAYQLAQELKVEMPITEGLYQLLYGQVSIREGIQALMMREAKWESNIKTVTDPQ